MELMIIHTSRTVCNMERIEKIASNVYEYLSKHFSFNLSDSFIEDEFGYVMRGYMNFSSVFLLFLSFV